MKKCVKSLSFVFFAFLAFCLGSSIINQKNNVYAVSDISYTVDSSNVGTYHLLCNTSTPCSDYSYLKIEFSATSVDTTGYSLPYYSFSILHNDRYTSSKTLNLQIYSNSVTYILSTSNLYQIDYRASTLINSSLISSDWSIIFTLTESLSSGAPSGSITLTENGTYDVTSYAQAVVDVPPTIEQGDYHDDLVSIRNVIVICSGVILVLYFFYCIYRLIIPTLGGRL